MKKKDKLLVWLKRPHGVPLVLICFSALVLIVLSLVLVARNSENQALAIISYGVFGLTAVLFGYTVYTAVLYAPSGKRRLLELLKRYSFTANLLENYGFKTTVFALASFAITAAFAVMNLVSAIHYRSDWYGALSAYYFGLMLFRGGIMLADRLCKKRYDGDKYEKCKWRIYLASGAFLVLLEIAMTVAITQMILFSRPTESGQIMAISNAVYTFYKLGMAVYHLIKAKKFRHPVVQSLRNLNFADACMSVVSLTVLMITTFSEESSSGAMFYMKAGIGFAVCAVLIAMATVMIISANRKLSILEGEDDNA